MAFIEVNVPIIVVSNINNETQNPTTFLSILVQALNKAIGVKNVVNNTSQKEMPSIPKK